MNRAGGGIDGVVDHREGSGRSAGRIVLREHAHRELVIGAEAAHGGEVLFRHVEVDEDRRDPMDHHQRNVIGLDQISRVDE